MDQGELVIDQIESGKRLIEALAAAGFDVRVAFWAKPTEDEPERHAQKHRQSKAPGHAEERSDDEFDQQSPFDQSADTGQGFERRGKEFVAGQANRSMPNQEEHGGDDERQDNAALAPAQRSACRAPHRGIVQRRAS